MARPLRITYPGAFYHVTTRGNERGNVFKSRRDREKFLSYLESATIRYGATIHAYCLMSNHFHLLLETSPEEIIRAAQDKFDGNEKLARNASIHICHKYSGAKLKDISQLFAVRESAITEASRRFLLKLEQEKGLREKFDQVKEILKI